MNASEANSELIANPFEERGEFLSREELERWTAESPRDRQILSKLTGQGAKLLSGPRGSGKSTYMKRAYYDLLEDDDVIAAYVNFARSLALEPLFHRRSDALQIFRQWVLYKIVLGISGSFAESGKTAPQSLKGLQRDGERYIRALERGDEPPQLSRSLAVSELAQLIDDWLSASRCRRCVLLLDDAAHAFSPEQQREFFEVFREVRSRRVAPKAAIYPGVTSYSPFFQVGHEAEVVEAWFQIEDDNYLEMMRDIAHRRLPEKLYARVKDRSELLDYLALGSFGLPRGFLVMLSFLLGVEEDLDAKPTRRIADKALVWHAESVQQVFSSLREKLPRYSRFVEVGEDLQRAILDSIRQYNQNKAPQKKAVSIGLRTPIGPELQTVIDLLHYAGLVRDRGEVSRGTKGRYQRFVVHYALLATKNSLAMGKSAALDRTITALKRTEAAALVKTQGTTLLGDQYKERCTIDLAPCTNCGEPRVSPDARYCAKCGKELTDTSIYEELLRTSVNQLPLTDTKRVRIQQYSDIRTVQDVLLDEGGRKLRAVPSIGRIWAARIRNYAEEFVSV